MKRLAVLLVASMLFTLPASAAVRVAEFKTGAKTSTFKDPDLIVSRDAYHYAAVTVGKDGQEILHKDGRELSRGPAGTFTSRDERGIEIKPQFRAALGDNGVLFHPMLFRESGGRVGWRIAMDASPKGALYERILQVAASPHGDNAAFVTKDGPNYALSTLSGRSPASPLAPQILSLSSSNLYFLLNWNGRNWSYRDLAVLPYREYKTAAAHPEGSALAGVYSEGGGHFLEVNGKQAGGPWQDAVPRYSAEGALVVLTRSSPQTPAGMFDSVSVNGRSHNLPAFNSMDIYPPTARPSDGTPFLVTSENGNSVINIGGRPMPHLGGPIVGRGWVGFSPSGRRWASLVIGPKRIQPVVDGEPADVSAPPIASSSRLVFDSEAEFHYIGDSLGSVSLVCVTLDGSDPAHSRCGRRAAAAGYEPGGLLRLAEPALKPALLKVTPQ